ncbi:MAG TPA: NAD(P)-dependent oxidoreductase [Rhabdaerophilum sp.]|nr:NAD(P)-dependent oxidoreductase [Rhabdaerophilum sp.]
MTAVGVIGLGNMGCGMALRLASAAHRVAGYDVSPEARQRIAAEGVVATETIAALCARSDLLILSLPNAEIVEAVMAGPDGVLAHARPGTLIVDTTTSYPETTRRIARLARDRGLAVVDAPVSGGPKGARAGTMTMVIGGEAMDLARAEPVLAAISAKRVHVGPVGAGHVAKLVNNLLCASHLLTAAEALAIIRGAGLDPARVMAGVNAGSGRSAVTEVNLPNWVLNDAFNSGFSIGLMRKDVGLAARLVEELGLDLPMAAAAAGLWEEAYASLGASTDFNAITAHPDFAASPFHQRGRA